MYLYLNENIKDIFVVFKSVFLFCLELTKVTISELIRKTLLTKKAKFPTNQLRSESFKVHCIKPAKQLY